MLPIQFNLANHPEVAQGDEGVCTQSKLFVQFGPGESFFVFFMQAALHTQFQNSIRCWS